MTEPWQQHRGTMHPAPVPKHCQSPATVLEAIAVRTGISPLASTLLGQHLAYASLSVI